MTKLRSTKKFEIVLDSNKLKWFYMSCAAALPQLDRGSDYESERHRFESYTPHHEFSAGLVPAFFIFYSDAKQHHFQIQ